MENNIQKEDLLALVKSKIYTIRGQKVMLDFDLAQMYEVETKRLNEAVRRNLKRFEGDDFIDMWTEYYDKMTDDDKNILPLKRISFLGSNE